MRFFVPGAKDDAEAESVYKAIRKHAVETTGHGVTDRRIYHMSWKHGGVLYESTVGKPDPRLREEVVAILEGAVTYLVCTNSRGVIRGEPMYVGKEEAYIVSDFEE